MLNDVKEKMAEKKVQALKSLDSSFDIFMEGKDCGEDKNECEECLEEHGDHCPMREAFKDAFYAGASAYDMHLIESWRSGEPGAISKKISELQHEIKKFSSKKIKGVLLGMFEL
jgi:hypothetical protein